MADRDEPSVEEILDSIKKVIARDNRAGAAEQRRVREARGMPQPEPEVLELREDAAAELEAEEVLDLGEAAEYFDEGELAEESDEIEDTGPLVGEAVRESMRDSLTALSMLAAPGAAPQIVRSGETSLEGLVRDLLRPALAEWLDKNLPGMVERLVAEEISRIVGRKG
jgi:cell pole-organizing protein PopZ